MATVMVLFEGDASIPPDMLWGTVRDLLVAAGSEEPAPSLEGVAWRMGTLDEYDESPDQSGGYNTDYSGPFPNEGE